MPRYFVDSDFNAFDRKYATSTEPSVIAARKAVVEHKIRPLHDGAGNDGLGAFLAHRDLYPHWQRQHLTNVYWPFHAANGGWVDYLRLGYGKRHDLVRELAKRSGVFTEITDQGTRDMMAFYCVTQLQLSLNQNGWGINLYIDRKGWLEQVNLMQKVSSSQRAWNQCVALLDGIVDQGYKLVLWTYPEERAQSFECAEDYLDAIRELQHDKMMFSASVEKAHKRFVRQNNENILGYVKAQFEDLFPLYEFMAWHPSKNNHIHALMG